MTFQLLSRIFDMEALFRHHRGDVSSSTPIWQSRFVVAAVLFCATVMVEDEFVGRVEWQLATEPAGAMTLFDGMPTQPS